ncbi:alkyl hydroperoxide reductase [Sulfurifustis variabilis]|uniref:Alkyl hydroperoxide reductase n=2 Tax=Sulfurifustis variabilis TaxID=1675686 RepID=A0A1B4V5V5_9GAMM|nr:alkyl hydroperoxide reductase [Sulfurifustis variabilis]
MSRMLRIGWVLLGIWAGPVWSGACPTAAPPGLIALDGRPAPGLRLPDLDGRTVDLKAFRGRWVMVHFWASWCAPCRREMPALARAAAGFGKDIALVLVNTAETEEEAFAFLGAVAPDLPSLLDRDGSATERWQPRGLPASFFVDPGGRLRWIALGGRPWDSPAYARLLARIPAC